MHPEDDTSGGVLYEEICGIEEAVEPPAHSPFVPNSSNADHRKAWAKNMHG
jgi:hypothetical protein